MFPVSSFITIHLIITYAFRGTLEELECSGQKHNICRCMTVLVENENLPPLVSVNLSN